MSTPTVLVIDGDSLAHRANFAYETSGLSNSKGQPVYAAHGFFSLLAGILNMTNPDALVIGFDGPNNIRRSAYPEYKATRKAKESSYLSQRALIIETARAAGINVVSPEGWEADDVTASVGALASGLGWKCVIATSDRDSFAHISDTTTVLRLVSGLNNAVWMTPEVLVEKYGVRPDQYLEFAALRGDKSDNLPGVPGIGEQTAVKLLETFGSVQAAVTACGLPFVGQELSDTTPLEALKPTLKPKQAFNLIANLMRFQRNCHIMAASLDIAVDIEASRPTKSAAELGQVFIAAELPISGAKIARALGV